MTNKITIEVGQAKSLPLVGREALAAVLGARECGTVTRVTRDGAEIAAVVPAGPGVPMSPRDLHEAVSALLSRMRAAFKPDAHVTDADVLGLLVARYLGFEPSDILAAAAVALEDANCHAEAAEVLAMGGTS